MNERVLVIVACSARKNDLLPLVPLPARLAYTGQAFRGAREYLESFGMRWVILSARYGILWPWSRIEFYNERLPARVDRTRWAGAFGAMRRSQRVWLGGFDRYVCLGGRAYCDTAETILGRAVERPLAGMGIGEQLHSLKWGKWDVQAVARIYNGQPSPGSGIAP